MTPFVLSLKSTIDRVLSSLAASKGLTYVDIDGSSLNSEQLLRASPAVAWSQTSYQDEMRTPFFTFMYQVGAVSVNDPAQYQSMDTLGAVLDVMGPGHSIDIYDYSAVAGVSGPTGPTGGKLGDMIIIDAAAQPMASDLVENLRIVNITARGARY